MLSRVARCFPCLYRSAAVVNEPPLTNRELRILRGMLDEHEWKQHSRQHWATAFGDIRVVVGVAGAGMLILMQAVELWLIASGRR